MTSATLLSPDWYRVAFLRPRLRAGIQVVRQTIRGDVWFVLTDQVAGEYHRFNRMAWDIVASFDGRRTLDDVWAARVAADGEDAPAQSEVIDILSQAFAANLLVGDIPPDAAGIVKAQSRARARKRRAAVNPLAFRIPLWDPDAFLDRHVDALRWMFRGDVLAALLGLVAVGVLLLLVNAGAFLHDARQMASTPRGLLLIWLAYPVIKALHEAAHAFAVKHYGGEVHSVGVTLLLLTPVPFVDASSSAAFESKRQRALVAAAGILTELLLAAIALTLWLLLEPGLAREAATAVVVIGGVSSLLVNGNPLLRFDGYHVMCDVLELPNLAQRSNRYWLELLRKYLLGLPVSQLGALARGEIGWLLAYAPLSWLLRLLMVALVAAALVDHMPAIGFAVLTLGAWIFLLAPLGKGLSWALRAAELQGRRTRALVVIFGGIVLAGTATFGVQLPNRSHAPGLVWLPDEALVRLEVDGFLEEITVRDGQQVAPGTPLLRLSNDQLLVALGKAEAELTQQRIDRASHFGRDALATAKAEDRIARLEGEVTALGAQRDALVVRAASAGRVAIDMQRTLPGMYLAQGTLAAHVVPDGPPLVRALVSNDDIGSVRALSEQAIVALPQGGPPINAQPELAVPQASAKLPSAALGEAAGGSIALDLTDKTGLTAREPRFRVDLRLPADVRAPIGARVLVTFDHGEASLVDLISAALRRGFLRHFDA